MPKRPKPQKTQKLKPSKKKSSYKPKRKTGVR